MTDKGLILCSQIQTARNETKWQEDSEFLSALDRWVRAVEQELEELQRKLRRVKHKRA
jgi:DNA topoisomerase IB